MLLFTLVLEGPLASCSVQAAVSALPSSHRTTSAPLPRLCIRSVLHDLLRHYSSVLIVGSSHGPCPFLGVPPERLAIIVHTMGVVLASYSPVSSWIGLQLDMRGLQAARL